MNIGVELDLGNWERSKEGGSGDYMAEKNWRLHRGTHSKTKKRKENR